MQALVFVLVPASIMLWRLTCRWHEGLSAAVRAPIGRLGDKRSPAAALRFFLFTATPYGGYLDVVQVRAPRAARRVTLFARRPHPPPPPAAGRLLAHFLRHVHRGVVLDVRLGRGAGH